MLPSQAKRKKRIEGSSENFPRGSVSGGKMLHRGQRGAKHRTYQVQEGGVQSGEGKKKENSRRLVCAKKAKLPGAEIMLVVRTPRGQTNVHSRGH